ncbi:hypothetical protein HZH66_005635 [Vespula vulgaris]|uniref:Uncharacterized protein n=1 Tax=Vespula vulgaris TaxID=7454 RepID=A0A834K744_VESVU|nr:hypothetical protein HZH66_005635 [Vespula vulgaris]
MAMVTATRDVYNVTTGKSWSLDVYWKNDRLKEGERWFGLVWSEELEGYGGYRKRRRRLDGVENAGRHRRVSVPETGPAGTT